MAIKLLDSETAAQIAAGEVVENPAAVVKELTENALDAGATRITIQVQEGGSGSITVTDNGTGIAPEDLELAFQRHATSKIWSHKDLFRVTTLGFRGEALPSIAAVARVTLTTRCKGTLPAQRIWIEGGKKLGREIAGAPFGTAVTVKDLFFNTPARHKFLRSASVELGRISTLVAGLALSHPEVSFSLKSGERSMLQTRGDGSLAGIVAQLYGERCAASLVPLKKEEPEERGPAISGLLSAPYYTRASRRFITVIVNDRVVKAPSLVYALERGYGGLLPRKRYPVAVMHLTVPPQTLDVNVHPAKTEVRFHSNATVNEFVYRAARQALARGAPAPLESAAGFTARRARPEEGPAKNIGQAQQFALENSPDYPPPPAGVDMDLLISAVAPKQEPVQKDFRPAEAIAEPTDTPRLVGQLWRSYIIALEQEHLLLLDQHAAHERVLYHALTGQGATLPGTAQLTIPVMVEIPLPWRERFWEIRAILEKAGFVLEAFGETNYVVREVPFSPFSDSRQEYLEGLFEELLEGEPSPEPLSQETVLKTVACHRAVKAGQILSRPEMEALLALWAVTPGREYCPHGRPAVLQFTRRELEKGFHRTGG